jgi:hypothetical protein
VPARRPTQSSIDLAIPLSAVPPQVAPDIMLMLTSNLFRALHPLAAHGADSYDLDEEEPHLEPAWPHLQVGGTAGRYGAVCFA